MFAFSSLKAKVGSLFAAVMLVAATLVAASTPASAAHGYVQCTNDHVVGMWIEVDGGTSGWAARTSTGDPLINGFSYDTQGKTWRATVGCGGSPSGWDKSITSNWTSLQGAVTVTCNDTYDWPLTWLNSCHAG